MENKIKHIELIQGVINRMINNSFLLKGWSVVLVSALFALSAKEVNLHFIYIAFFPAFAFWMLDGFFLWQERLYRKLYDKVRMQNEDQIDFSMDASDFKKNIFWFNACFTPTLLIFHGGILTTILIVIIVVLN